MRFLKACIVATALSAATAKKKKRRRPTDNPRAAEFSTAAGGAARAPPAAGVPDCTRATAWFAIVRTLRLLARATVGASSTC